MKKFSAYLVVLFAGTSLCALPGCERTPPPTQAVAKPTPEESFALIVDTFKRGIEDVQVGFLVPEAGGHSRMSGKNTVTHKLIPPTKPGEPFRAVISVESQSTFSVQRNPTAPEAVEEASEGENTDAGDRAASGVEILDSDLVQNRPAKTEKAGDPDQSGPSVSRMPNERKRDYELIYQDGRWFLTPTTQFDKDTESAIENAFQRALATQV